MNIAQPKPMPLPQSLTAKVGAFAAALVCFALAGVALVYLMVAINAGYVKQGVELYMNSTSTYWVFVVVYFAAMLLASYGGVASMRVANIFKR